MKHTSKRLQALVLVLAMCVSFLQIPSFATADDETHTNVYSVSKVSIEKDGSFTIAEKCSNHKDATKACNEVTGLIATKVDELKGTIVDTANSKVPTLKCNKEVEISIVPQAATCSEAGKLTYVVSIDGVDSTRSVENGTATGRTMPDLRVRRCHYDNSNSRTLVIKVNCCMSRLLRIVRNDEHSLHPQNRRRNIIG